MSLKLRQLLQKASCLADELGRSGSIGWWRLGSLLILIGTRWTSRCSMGLHDSNERVGAEICSGQDSLHFKGLPSLDKLADL